MYTHILLPKSITYNQLDLTQINSIIKFWKGKGTETGIQGETGCCEIYNYFYVFE